MDENSIYRDSILPIKLALEGIKAVSGVKAASDLTSDNTQVTAGKVVVIGDNTYTFVAALSEDAASDASLTSDNTNPSSGDTVTIGDITYTFRTALTTNPEHIAYEVLIGADADTTLANLKAAINGAAGAGTLYSSGTVKHPYVTAGAITSHVLAIDANEAGASYEALATTETSSHLSFGDTTMENGTHTVAYEVLIGADADETLANLKAAINGAAGEGTTYGVGTVAHPDVVAGTIAAHVLPIEAAEAGTDANSIATTTDETHLAWDGATLDQGTEGVDAVAQVDPEAEIGVSGLAHVIYVKIPEQGTATYVLTIEDEDGVVLYTSSSLADAQTHKLDLSVPMMLSNTDKVVITPSAEPDTGSYTVLIR